MNLHDKLNALGSQRTDYRYDQPDAALLERFPNPYAEATINPHGVTGSLNITCPELPACARSPASRTSPPLSST